MHQLQICMPASNPAPSNDYNSIIGKEQRPKRGSLEHFCAFCSMGFAHISKLGNHLREAHGVERPFKCGRCDASFSNADSVSRHQHTHSATKQFSCELCHYATNQKHNLTVHQRRHAKDFTYRCDSCGAGYMQRTKFLEHVASHELGSPAHRCRVCDKAFNYKRNLVAHVKSCHPETRQDYTGSLHVCGLCLVTFAKEHQLKRHLKRNHENRQLPNKQCLCHVCGAQLSSPTELRRHVRGHNGEKVAECETCGQCFSKLANLKVHQRLHSGEKPYKCLQCGKSFVQRTPLVHHLRTHTGEKPYECNLCDKQFVSSSRLLRHAKSHDKNQEAV